MTELNNTQLNAADQAVDSAVAEGGAYEVISKRLAEQGKQLFEQAQELNTARLVEFGSADMAVIGRTRVRTEHNCIARDIVQVGEHLLFGYNVFIGLKKETKVEDVFALFDIEQTENGVELKAVEHDNHFLKETSFVNDFSELYRYYKNTKLIQLAVKDGKLLAAFQIGEKLSDVRVFRWSISSDGKAIKYIDNRGERDIQPPPDYDFEWIEATRDDIVNGRHPHISILDTVFVETIGGDLTVKIENNTDNGLGIYSEPVEDETQSLDDCKIAYASVGNLILLKVLPYKESTTRYLVYNKLNEEVMRIDAIGESCVQLPEDHGLIFPGGLYLQNGEYKRFDENVSGLKFQRAIRSPNGEDVLYAFYEPDEGVVGLFGYNLINKQLQNPIFCHGYALAESGQLVVFSAVNEATRVHPMQVWQTPYVSAEFASAQPQSQTFYGKIGNAELVRGISDIYSICRNIESQSVSSRLYEALAKASKRVFDDHYWLSSPETETLAQLLQQVAHTSELVIDEFEKVQSIQQQSKASMREAEQDQKDLLQKIRPDSWQSAEDYVNALSQLRHQRGHLITIRDYRYIDIARLDALDEELQQVNASLSEKTVEFLSSEQALDPYFEKITMLNSSVENAETIAELTPIIEDIESTTAGLDLLTELMNTLKVADATVRTQIIDAISNVYSKLNQSKANANHKKKGLGSSEAIAQFGAQFKLFSQSIVNALGLATSPEKCDEQLSRLLVQLEELESQFSEYDQFLSDIMDKREEIYESFESHKQQLLDAQQRKAQSLTDAAGRMLTSIEKRSLKFTSDDELNTYFATDALVMKIRDLVQSLRELDAAVKADDIESRAKSLKEQALRSLRDKTDIFEEGGNVIKLGPRHKFSVNTQELDLTIIPRDGDLNIHLTGTDFFEPINNEKLHDLKDYWDLSIESETNDIYRAEYLASIVLAACEQGREGLTSQTLRTAIKNEDELIAIVKSIASPRYKEGYQKGVHDFDAAKILAALVPVLDQADLLRFDPLSRGMAQVFWASQQGSSSSIDTKSWAARAQSAFQLAQALGSNDASLLLCAEVFEAMQQFNENELITENTQVLKRAANYLVEELANDQLAFITSQYATELVEALQRSVNFESWTKFQQALNNLETQPASQWQLAQAWLEALVQTKQLTYLSHYIPEAIALLIVPVNIERRSIEANTEINVDGLMGEHERIKDRSLRFSLDSFILRTEHHRDVVVPTYHHYLDLRQEIISTERNKLRLHEFKARPLSSFVRNRLINESYLPLIGDNLAKQMGTVGDSKRTDLMGLLMMISPPGYGKTTLMEYVANRLGLIFMKINCPSLGHDVMSLDPQQAPNATAKQELQKLNLGLEMGNNVMLYLDDIQHTHPEFLQKFISLCDGSRRIEGVWKEQTKTYDMRGKKFCVVMAGNPYTESGEAFKIPDMLANRADIYNLGDILGGMDEQFALSYIENALTSNPALAPLAVREMDDIYNLIKMAQGKNIAATDLSHQYSGAEIQEITGIFKKMFVVQDVVLKINKQYIASAAQDDKYRNEPSFKLQGSYRNMNKMTEKISAVMNDDEMMQMIADHYIGEAQLLTTGAEANLLKLAELRGNMTEAQSQRWAQIKKDFLRNKAIGGDEGDVGGKVVAQLADMADGLGELSKVGLEQKDFEKSAINDLIAAIKDNKPKQENDSEPNVELVNSFEKLASAIQSNAPKVEVINEPVQGLGKILEVLATSIEESIFPIMHTMDKKLDIDMRTHDRIKDLADQIRGLEKTVNERTRTNG
ncbi:DNA repair ATPase [Reinekea forsetii]|nr:DNA repair ATPase [Reinekea forsetii]